MKLRVRVGGLYKAVDGHVYLITRKGYHWGFIASLVHSEYDYKTVDPFGRDWPTPRMLVRHRKPFLVKEILP